MVFVVLCATHRCRRRRRRSTLHRSSASLIFGAAVGGSRGAARSSRPGALWLGSAWHNFLSCVHLQMERETLRRQAEEARRCGAAESINGVPLDADGTKPIFGPPVKIRNRDDSLHRKLQKCLGNFDDVSGYLFKDMHYSGRGMELSVGPDSGVVRTGGHSRLNGRTGKGGTAAAKGQGAGRRPKNGLCNRGGHPPAQGARRRRSSSSTLAQQNPHARNGWQSVNDEQQQV
uniref:Uncharacterized protein n=1 Tax=Trichuris muris TaxID=70415 RepID=A0A5S6QQR4_TRIMR